MFISQNQFDSSLNNTFCEIHNLNKCSKGRADLILYGNREDMTESHHAGTKYLWAGTNGVLEMHGKEKLSWTHLDEHIFRDNVPVEQLKWKQYRWSSYDKSGATRSWPEI